MKAILMVMLFANATSLTSAQQAEVRRVEERLLAPCCYTQSIEVHGSEIAGQMRAEVAQMIARGRKEEEIVNHYRNIYGDRILIVPDGVTGKVLFGLPLVTSALASLILFVSVRKMLRSEKERLSVAQNQRTSVTDKSLRERIEREIGESFE